MGALQNEGVLLSLLQAWSDARVRGAGARQRLQQHKQGPSPALGLAPPSSPLTQSSLQCESPGHGCAVTVGSAAHLCPAFLFLTDETSFEAGIKVQIHSQDEPPLIDQLGFGVAPGFQTFVSCQEQRVRGTASPGLALTWQPLICFCPPFAEQKIPPMVCIARGGGKSCSTARAWRDYTVIVGPETASGV